MVKQQLEHQSNRSTDHTSLGPLVSHAPAMAAALKLLPPFLHPYDLKTQGEDGTYHHTLYHHASMSEAAHTIWWPPVDGEASTPSTVLLFIPGQQPELDHMPYSHCFSRESGITGILCTISFRHLEGLCPRTCDFGPFPHRAYSWYRASHKPEEERVYCWPACPDSNYH